jgi:hypothetical protein
MEMEDTLRTRMDPLLHQAEAHRLQNKYLLPMCLAFGAIPMIGFMTYLPLDFVIISSPFSALLGDPQFMLLLLPFIPFVALHYSKNARWNTVLEYVGIVTLAVLAIGILIEYIVGGYVNFNDGIFFSLWLILAITGFTVLAFAALLTAIRRKKRSLLLS